MSGGSDYVQCDPVPMKSQSRNISDARLRVTSSGTTLNDDGNYLPLSPIPSMSQRTLTRPKEPTPPNTPRYVTGANRNIEPKPAAPQQQKQPIKEDGPRNTIGSKQEKFFIVVLIFIVLSAVPAFICMALLLSQHQDVSNTRPSSEVATNGNLLGPNQTKLDTLNDRLLSVSRILAYHDELLLQSLSSIDKLQDELRNKSVFIYGSLSGCSAPAVCGAIGGFLYSRGKCYIYILQSATYDQAKRLCLSNLSSLAEFEDRAQEMEVLNALKAATSLGDPEFWIGMRYISRNGSGHVQYASGRQVSYSQFKWHESSPSSSHSNIVVEVSKTDQNHFGLWTYDPSSSVTGALCEMTF